MPSDSFSFENLSSQQLHTLNTPLFRSSSFQILLQTEPHSPYEDTDLIQHMSCYMSRKLLIQMFPHKYYIGFKGLSPVSTV